MVGLTLHSETELSAVCCVKLSGDWPCVCVWPPLISTYRSEMSTFLHICLCAFLFSSLFQGSSRTSCDLSPCLLLINFLVKICTFFAVTISSPKLCVS